MAGGENQAHLILLRKFPGEIEPQSALELRIAIEIEGQRREFRFESEIAVEKIRILPENFEFVTAPRPFRQGRERPAVAKEIAVAETRANNPAGVRPITQGEANFFAFGFLR